MVEEERFIKGYEDLITNADFDKDKEERYNKNLHILKRIVQVVKLCAEQGLQLRGYQDNSTEEFTYGWYFHDYFERFCQNRSRHNRLLWQ